MAIPKHIAIIMDGNGRWAKKRFLPVELGHHEGVKALRKVARYCSDIGIKYLTVYTFSTENWKRSPVEVDALMNLALVQFSNFDRSLDMKIKILGDKAGLSKKLQSAISKIEAETSSKSGMQLNIAFNYGGRSEIINAVKECLKHQNDLNAISQDSFEQCLCTTGIPDPELIIRTGGEQRLSNFLTWQSIYSELWFTETLWPDADGKMLDLAISYYQKSTRNFGNH